MPSDAPWQRLAKARRAAVYRAFGRAIRDARDDHDMQLAGDMRLAFDVLRAHAKAPRSRAHAKGPRSRAHAKASRKR